MMSCARRDPQSAVAYCMDFSGQKDYTDGLSFEVTGLRCNVRMSNTELVLRLPGRIGGARGTWS